MKKYTRFAIPVVFAVLLGVGAVSQAYPRGEYRQDYPRCANYDGSYRHGGGNGWHDGRGYRHGGGNGWHDGRGYRHRGGNGWHDGRGYRQGTDDGAYGTRTQGGERRWHAGSTGAYQFSLITPAEFDAYLDKLYAAKNLQECQAIESDHNKLVQERAAQHNVTPPEQTANVCQQMQDRGRFSMN